MAASSSPGNNGGLSVPFYFGNKGNNRRSSDSMSSFGSPITFTARPASSDTIEDVDKSDSLDHNENASSHSLNTVLEVPSEQSQVVMNGGTDTSSEQSNRDNATDTIQTTSQNELVAKLSASAQPSGISVQLEDSCNPRTSTPLNPDTKRQRPESLTQSSSAARPALDAEDELNSSFSSNVSVQSTQSQTDSDVHNNRFQVPILGYEVMEERARFTIYKIAIHKGDSEKWFIFRRYNDFVHLNDQLKELFPHFRLALPPKKWFGDNFDRDFIDDRMLGLQAFLNNIVGHRDVCNSEPVKEFFCFEDPPGPHDSLEESKAMCEILEEELYSMKRDLREKDAQINLLKEEMSLKNAEIDNLRKSLRIERALNSTRLKERVSPSSQSQKSESSLPEALMETGQTTGSLTLTSPGGQDQDPSTLARDIDDLKLSNQNQSTVKDQQVSPTGGEMPNHRAAPSSRKDSKSSLRKDSTGKAVIKTSKRPMPAS